MNAQPSRRERFRPLELIGLAFVVAIFTGVVVLITARDIHLAVIFFGGAFVVALVGLAMLALVAGPIGPDQPDAVAERPGGPHT
ncbi:MAG: hypothetical protein JWP66_518 [Naasia sp.]|nr:hypothetical protein [Naasia sp.]